MRFHITQYLKKVYIFHSMFELTSNIKLKGDNNTYVTNIDLSFFPPIPRCLKKK